MARVLTAGASTAGTWRLATGRGARWRRRTTLRNRFMSLIASIGVLSRATVAARRRLSPDSYCVSRTVEWDLGIDR